MGEKAAEVAAKGVVDASQTMANGLGGASYDLSNAIREIAPMVGIDAAKTLGDAGIAMSKNLGDAGIDMSKILGDSGKDISRNIALGIGTIVAAYALKEIAYAGKSLYQYCYPDEKEKEQIAQAQERTAIIDTKRAFRECLLKNAKAPRNKVDLPVACEEYGHAFATTAGTAEFQKMAEAFNLNTLIKGKQNELHRFA